MKKRSGSKPNALTIAKPEPWSCGHWEARKFPGGGRFSSVIYCPACGGLEKYLRRRHHGEPEAFDWECMECGAMYYTHQLDGDYCGQGCTWWYLRMLYHYPNDY